ncbi:centrosomal protein of 83 kDa [Palaemon carinicauda]|uniref:centrosomal protein of 83 kDa n=1 Tax=Palaemon carinicauda TaxID=392227 RepID=UPI0035B66215
MSSTDSSDDQALAETGPSHNVGNSRFHEADITLQRSLTTYRYENALVKTELSAALERHAREINELKFKYQSQIRDVEKKRGEIEVQLKEVQEKYMDENRQLQQINLHLQQQLTIAEEELDSANKAVEKSAKDKSLLEELWQQRMLASQTSLQSLKEENNRLKENLEKVTGDLDKERVTVREITTTLNSERHQQQLIKSRISEVEQQCKIQLTSAQAEASQLRQKLEQETSAGANRIKELMTMLEEEKSVLVRFKERASAKELEMEKRLAEEKQSVLCNSQQLIKQNAALQERIKNLETTLNNYGSKSDAKVSELEAKEQRTQEKLHEVEREKVVLEARVVALENLEGLLRKEREDSSLLRQELHLQRAEAEQLQSLNAELQQQIKLLKNKVADHEDQQEAIKKDSKKEIDTEQRLRAEQQALHQEELEQLRARIAALQTNFNDRNKSYLEECTQLKQKVRTYAKLIKKLRYKLEIGEVQLEQLEAQQSVLKDNVPSHVYRRLYSQLQDIVRKHNEFAAFIRGLSEFQSALPEDGKPHINFCGSQGAQETPINCPDSYRCGDINSLHLQRRTCYLPGGWTNILNGIEPARALRLGLNPSVTLRHIWTASTCHKSEKVSQHTPVVAPWKAVTEKKEQLREVGQDIIEDIKETKAKVKEQMDAIIERENIWTIPNLLCISRIVCSPILCNLVITGEYKWALGLFMFAGFTDLLDGWIARTFPNQASRLGSFLDPLADKVLVAMLFLSLTYVGLIPLPLTVIIVYRDLVIIGGASYVRYKSLPPPRTIVRYFDATHATAQLAPTTLSKINTAIQLGLITASLAAPVFGYVDHHLLTGLCWVTGVTTIGSGLTYIFSKDTYKILRHMKKSS